MEPRRKSSIEPAIYLLCLAAALYVALHAAAAGDYVNCKVLAGKIAESSRIIEVLKETSDRIEADPFGFAITPRTGKYLIYAAAVWLLAAMAAYSSKKNYIHGKEFGTAKWGTIADIKDLFAESMMKREIRSANEVRTVWGRLRAQRRLYRECGKNARAFKREKLRGLKEKEAAQRKSGRYDRKLHKDAVKAIRREASEMADAAKCQAWKPRALKKECRRKIAAIEASPLYGGDERRRKKARAKSEYREAMKKFMDASGNIERIKAKYKDADIILTKTEHISIHNRALNINTLILGGSGSGKTRGYVMPNILQAHSSYVVTDPKGEILEKAGYFLSKVKGYKIRVLNLDEKGMSDGYNPFIYIHPEREGCEERVLTLIETIIINTDGGEKKPGTDPFWDKAERLFLQSIFFFVCDGFVEEERNMGTVLALIAMLKIAEDGDNYDSDLDYFARIFEKEHGSGHIGVQQFKEFREKAGGKTAKSIVISAVARLAPFMTKAVQRIFSHDNMGLDAVGEEKTAIFVVVPPTDATFNFIAGMLFTQLFQELQYCATQKHKHDGQRLPVPCRFILDEFANTCKIPNFVKILAYARSFGIGITPILQSLEQIKNMYKDEWGVIVDSCNTLLYLGGISHMDTLEYVSKLLGKGTFDKRATGRTRGRQGSSSENFDVIGRELLDVSEIRKIDKRRCLLIASGRNPFYSEKYAYEAHPNYRYTSDADAAYRYAHAPERPAEDAEMARRADEALPVSRETLEYLGKIRGDDAVLETSPLALLKVMADSARGLEPLADEYYGQEGDGAEYLMADAVMEGDASDLEDGLDGILKEITGLNLLIENDPAFRDRLMAIPPARFPGSYTKQN